ncbi:glycosyltransferase family 4 protein [Isoptericola haloaureus]|uniref:Glycosyltransferase family 4 protein n=1 Tax=Isoptericola haloaureus TaxID=1542902 RepID=A0ABU7Z4L6_9MICO
MQRRHIHVITPGDHFSPRTGSAIPTVVHGLASAAPSSAPRPSVVVARGTYPDRYPSADVIEYSASPPRPRDRWGDAVCSRITATRPGRRREFAAPLAEQGDWAPGIVLAHNAPQAIPLVDPDVHAPVLYAHNDLLGTYSRREVAKVLDRSTAVVCVSAFLADVTRERMPSYLHDRVHVVRNGVDTTQFAPAAEGSGRDRLEVLFVGRMVPSKGAHVALAAMGRLGDRDVRLTIVGSAGFDATQPLDDYEKEIRREAAALGARARVLPFVPRDEVARLMSTADVLVVPSVWPEPFALTALEGLASGCAVVASRTGGIPEATGDAGVLVEPDDPAQIAAALTTLHDDSAALAAAQDSARRYALAHDWRRTWDTLAATLPPADRP